MDSRGFGLAGLGVGGAPSPEKRRRLEDGHRQPSLHPSLHPQYGGSRPELLRPKASAAAPPRHLALQGPRYRAECILGKGSFGVVYKASVVDTGQPVAIKSVKMKESSREVSVLLRMRGGANVVQLLGTFPGSTDGPVEDRMLNLVLEYVPDTLQRIIKHHRASGTMMEMFFIRLYMCGLLRGLACIAGLGIVHRDIKPANLLVDSATHQLKVCDFGTARLPEAQEAGLLYVCSRYYRAPELILSTPSYSTTVDLWSCGCVLAEMMVCQPLFPGRDGVDQLRAIAEVLGTPTPSELYAMNPQYDAAVGFGPPVPAQPWERVVSRPDVSREAVDLLSQLLQYDPAARPHAVEALAAPLFDELRGDVTRGALFALSPAELALATPEVQERLRGAHMQRRPSTPPGSPARGAQMLALRWNG